VTAENPRGNRPRYPIVIGEVDLDSGCLIADSVTVVDDCKEDDSDQMTLSNFYAREDHNGDVILYMPRLFAQGAKIWTADLMAYQIVLKS